MYFLTCTYFISFILMFITGLILIPVIRRLSFVFGYFANPNCRSSHQQPIPNIGGLVFYVVFIFALVLIKITGSLDFSSGYILLAPAILLMLGLLDDKWSVAVNIKALVQLAAIVLFINYTGIQFTDIYGISHLNDQSGFYLTMLFIFIVLNAFNLVDGIDGLTSMLALVSMIISSWILSLYNNHFDSIFLIAFSGLLLSFLISNLRKKNKIIMGDTGSMLIGFISGFAILKIYQIGPAEQFHWETYASQAAIFSLIAYPVMDMSRVFFVRIFNHSSPFKADRRHFHHILLDYFLLSHLQASLVILSIHIIIIIAGFLLIPYLSIWGYISFYLTCLVVFGFCVYLICMKVPYRADSVQRKALTT